MTEFDNFIKDVLLEMPQISLAGKTVMAGDKPLKESPLVEVEENMVLLRQPTDSSFIAEGYTLVYFMDNAESAEKMKAGIIPYLIVPQGTFMSGGSPITDVWKKRFQKAGHEHILGLFEGNTKEDVIFADMLSVRKKYQRASISTKIFELLKTKFPQAKIMHSSATDDGRAFLQSQGVMPPERRVIKLRGHRERDEPSYDDPLEA